MERKVLDYDARIMRMLKQLSSWQRILLTNTTYVIGKWA